MIAPSVESLLSARLFLNPQTDGDRVYFISDLSGRLSLYRMRRGGSVPEPLLPRGIALMTPELLGGIPFFVFPGLGKVMVMIDSAGDENYQPYMIPMDGGVPTPLFGDRFAGMQLICNHCDPERNVAAFNVDPRTDPTLLSYLVDLVTEEITDLGGSIYGNTYAGSDDDFGRVALVDEYTSGDTVLYLWERGREGRRLLLGKPLDARGDGEAVTLSSIKDCTFTPGGGLLFYTSLFEDRYGPGYLKPDGDAQPAPVTVTGIAHAGDGELCGIEHLAGERYLLTYNIDGCTWCYEGTFDEAALALRLGPPIIGREPLEGGVAESVRYDKAADGYAVSFSTATSPAQIYTLDGPDRLVTQHTAERPLGLPDGLLSPGEDAAFTSHDGLRVSARLYLPAPELGFEGPRPVVFYVHGGPQGQERPDFTWFSMPLIQQLALNGFAVFAPNARGSSGYGLDYMKQVDRDWGGLDRLDHVAALEQLGSDPRIDTSRAAVVGRSYGGYMTLTLAARHPGLWSAACDMFGPYDLFSFLDRIPEAWKTYFHLAVGHPEKDHDWLVERSPSTHMDRLACPLLVIQGRNDPRVVAAESEDLVRRLRTDGKQVELIIFEDEGHDVTRFENKVRCYEAIVDFFKEHLRP
jgi:pimeloyl-ACP methyl ester carboxylesterase